MGESEAACLSVFKGRRERLLEWLEGEEVYVSVWSGLTPTAMALQGWLLPSSQPFPLIPAVRNPVLSLLVSLHSVPHQNWWHIFPLLDHQLLLASRL